ncbi:hypothetical protein QE400_000073 [Xanthomonas sacchari]|uniref:hypothetical protein n=1 Tax=Xanthomonas sacchari TaxID=56458 RepID=UPI0027838C6B|nr:hypothetical protein [Xanthomonas sacchari]MDQ1090660.1 hypothetical protein [Xanthomonas sacchari]
MPSDLNTKEFYYSAIDDEYGDYALSRFKNDALIRELREINAVPNASYMVVAGNRVFVFEKLVQMAAQRLREEPTTPVADLAIQLVDEATVSAQEAVSVWNIVPEPYHVVEEGPDEFAIWHRPLNARVPETFSDKRGVQESLVKLLLGSFPLGDGYTQLSIEPIAPEEILPPRPSFAPEPELSHSASCYFCHGHLGLQDLAFEDGFTPLTEALFDQVKSLTNSWARSMHRAALHVRDQAQNLWEHVPALGLDALNSVRAEVPSYGKDDGIALRSLYPELYMLSDGSLYEWFSGYQAECLLVNGVMPNRDDDFLLYLLGQLGQLGSVREHGGDRAKRVGEMAGYAVLRGDSKDRALAFGEAVVCYDDDISTLAGRVASATRFLKEVREGKGPKHHQGPPMVTYTEMVGGCRSTI